ncbi:MAG: ferrochelatase [bacterium]|nr:ferrochelatase [bacterium]
MPRRAIVLFNLGGPLGPKDVKPFLYNLFSDPSILRIPGLVRPLLAWWISKKRTPEARKIYNHLGGGSPLLKNTQAQARALEKSFDTEEDTKVFVCMRYWAPQAKEVVALVKDWNPDEVVLLPLYPQFSTTTTGSSFAQWRQEARRQGLAAPERAVGCYPTQKGWVRSLAFGLSEALKQTPEARILFSAHGLPLSIVNQGDPYPVHVEKTAQAVIASLGGVGVNLDWGVSYQSRVGPKKWLTPSTESEVVRAGRGKKSLIVVPVSFVSEHSETLVELDIEYRDLAEREGVPSYVRVPAVGLGKDFIGGLRDLVLGEIPESGCFKKMEGCCACF